MIGARILREGSSMTDEEFLAILERMNPIENPNEEKELLDESFEEGFNAFLVGDDAYEEWEKAQDEDLNQDFPEFGSKMGVKVVLYDDELQPKR